MDRMILHSDINACYASIELLRHPELRGRPVAVGGERELRHGIILAKDQMARAAGVRTGMTLWAARQQCPELTILPPDFDLYYDYSRRVREVYAGFTDRCEPFGMDECWLDMTGCVGHEDALRTAQEVRQRVLDATGLTVSVGVSWCKAIAKLGSDYRGDPSAALLEALDPEQNSTFRDNFLEVPFDLSDVFFITTANSLDTIPRALLDRMEVIELSSYTDEEKLSIAKQHLLPKQRKKHGLKAAQLKVSDDAIREIISYYTRESGVRNLERQIAALCRKAAVSIADGERKSLSLRSGALQPYLGAPKFKPEHRRMTDEIGLVRGLAWTSVGGGVLDVEVAVVDGSGKLELTGNLGNVMKESCQAAMTCIRSRAGKLGIEADFYKTKDIHIHFPEGAIPKDGPSAGVTVCTAIVSALTGTPVRRDIAMTGEISLRGRVLPIGGLKEKTMAAMRNGVGTVIIPADNEPDLEEIDPTVRKALNFVLADKVDTVLETALVHKDSDNKHEVIMPVSGKKSRPEIRQ